MMQRERRGDRKTGMGSKGEASDESNEGREKLMRW